MTKTATRLALASILAISALAVAGCGGSAAVPTDAVAVVDGTEVSRADLDQLIDRARKYYTLQKQDFPKAGTPQFQSLQTTGVAYLVQRVQYEQQAEKLGVGVTQADVDKRLAQVLKQPYLHGDKAKLASELKKQGYTTEQFRSDLRALVLRDKLVADVTKDVKVDDADVKAAYDKNQAQYSVPESRDMRHILISVRKADNAIDYVKSRALAEDVYKQLQNGADFGALAKKYSQDPGSKDNGGQFTVQRGQTVAPYEQAAFKLGVHERSHPVKSEYGYFIIEPLSAVKPGQVTPLAKVRAQIEKQLLSTKKNEAITEWSAALRKEYESKIDYAAGFAPATTETPTTTTTAQD